MPESPNIILPEGARIEDIEDNEMLIRGKEFFNLTHRRFVDIDHYFSGMISQLIDDFSTKLTDRPVRVLDIGGGVSSEAVRDIEQRYGDRVSAVNVDIAHDINLETDTKRTQAEVQHLPIKPGSIDIAYSKQLFPFIGRLTRQHKPLVAQGLAEVARALSPGGIALIDDEEEISGEQSAKKRELLAENLGVDLEVRNSPRIISFREFPRVWKKHERPGTFLIVKKSTKKTNA